MEDLFALIVFIVFILGGGCSLAGTWWYKNKRHANSEDMSSKDSSF